MLIVELARRRRLWYLKAVLSHLPLELKSRVGKHCKALVL